MGRLSFPPLHEQYRLDEAIHLARYQPSVCCAYYLRPKRSNILLSVVLAMLWWWLLVKALEMSWEESMVVAVAGGLLLWVASAWWDRTGVPYVYKDLGSSCYMDFEHRVIQMMTKAPARSGPVVARFHGRYVSALFNLNAEPNDVWSIGVVETGQYGSDWSIELRHRSKGPICGLVTVQSIALPAMGTAHKVDELVDVLCLRLGVRRSGSRLKALKRRQ